METPVRLTARTLLVVLFCLATFGIASGQKPQGPEKKEQPPTNVATNEGQSGTKPDEKPAEPILIYLVDGRKLQVEEINEKSDGVWYRQGSVTTLLDRERVARIERPGEAKPKQNPEAEQEVRRWTLAEATKVEKFFRERFGRPLPTSAVGQSDLHDRWGLDHRQGMDVGLHPDSFEGLALVNFLRSERIPFMAFRSAIPGVATGPHIHIGYASHRFLPR